MKDVMGVIFTSADNFAMRELTSNRSVTALPVAARYRLVDFLLSNLVNSGINKVGILVQGNYNSLVDHIGGAKAWNLHTRNNGLYMLPPTSAMAGTGIYQGIPDALSANMEFLRRSSQEFVLIVGGRILYNTRFDDMIKAHIASRADVTLLYTRYDPVHMDAAPAQGSVMTFVKVEQDGRVTDMQINPNTATYPNMLMDVVLIKRTLLMQLVDSAVSHGLHELNRHILLPAIHEGRLNVHGFEFNGYCRRMESINSYFNMSLELLDPDVRKQLFGINPVFTKTRDDAPSRYLEGANVSNSLLADGCVIQGEVTGSVLFRGVRIGKNARIRNSIIMQDCEIGDDAELENVILDKDVTILKGGRLIGHKQYPIVLGKNVTL